MSSREDASNQNNGAPPDPEHNGNGNGNAEESESGVSNWRFSNVVEDFTFTWFILAMDTGILSILLHQLPWQFNGSGVLSTILFVFNIVLFAGFFVMILLRLVMFPKKLAHALRTDVSELTMTAAATIAWFTLCAQVALTASTASWGGHSFLLLAYAMWWIGTFVMVCTAIYVFTVTGKIRITSTVTLSPAIVMPLVGTTTDAVVGALIVSYGAPTSAGLAIPVIIISYMLIGIGFFTAILAFSIYWVRMMNHGLPPPEESPSLFLLVGPPGQSASAIIFLGYASSVHFGDYNKGTFFTNSAGETLSAVGVLIGLMFLGLATFFVFFAVYMVLEVAWQRKHKYSLLWWSTIFPIATVNTAFISLATSLESAAFEGLAAALLIILFVDYFVNWGFTFWGIWKGQLLSGRKKMGKRRE